MTDPTARLRAVLAFPGEPASVPALLAAVEDVSLDVARAALPRLVPLAGLPRSSRCASFSSTSTSGSWGTQRPRSRRRPRLGGRRPRSRCGSSAIRLRGGVLVAAVGDGAALLTGLVDPRLEVRDRALVALERLCGERLDGVLESALPGAGDVLRRGLAEVLGRRRQTAAVLRYVGDPSPDVRIAVAHASAGSRASHAQAALQYLREDDVVAVRNAAAVALERG